MSHNRPIVSSLLISGQGYQRQKTYHQQSPDGVVEEEDGGSHEHGETGKFVQLSEEIWSAMVPW